MAIDPSIPLQGRGIDLASIVGQGINAYQGAQRNALLQRQADLQAPLIQAQTKSAQTRLDADTAKFQLGDAAQDAMMIKPLLASDPARAIAAMDARIQKITARGGDPSDTKALRDGLASGQITPQQAMGELDTVIGTAERFGVLGAEGLSEYQRQNLDLQRRRLDLAESLTPAQAANIQIQQQRLQQQQPEFVAGVEGAKTRAQLQAQGDLAPGVEAAKTRATEGAKSSINLQEVQRKNSVALNVYDTAIANLATSLGATMTAPGMGWLPAITSDAQKAEGARAAMAPVLKDIFRQAGEGTFTEGDQKLLLQMIPDRNTLPAARDAQLQAIDKIVRAKLGGNISSAQPPAQAAQQGGGYQQGQIIEVAGKRYRVTGGDPNDPDVEEVP